MKAKFDVINYGLYTKILGIVVLMCVFALAAIFIAANTIVNHFAEVFAESSLVFGEATAVIWPYIIRIFTVVASLLALLYIGLSFALMRVMQQPLQKLAQDIAQLTSAKEDLEAAAYTDTLTSLFNRRYFMEFAQVQLNRVERQNGNAYIIMLDIDFFKRVNDTYGHQIGDEVLKFIAARVKGTVRSYDLLARYGGEEFILLITDTPKVEVWNLVERIRLNICKQPASIEELIIPVTASFGVVEVFPLKDLAQAITLADKSLYQAKNSGRNCSVFYGEDYSSK